MAWALIIHPTNETLFKRTGLLTLPKLVNEHKLPAERRKGWIVLVRESELSTEPPPAQSNPRRIKPHGTVEDDGA